MHLLVHHIIRAGESFFYWLFIHKIWVEVYSETVNHFHNILYIKFFIINGFHKLERKILEVEADNMLYSMIYEDLSYITITMRDC